MKFSIVNEALLVPLQLVCGVIEKRHTNPILGNVLITIDANTLTLTATDSEIELVTKVSLIDDKLEPGEITVPGKKLLDICKSLKSEDLIHFSCKDSKAIVRTPKSRFSLQTQAASDFPSIEDVVLDDALQIDQNLLKNLIDYTQFAMAQQDVRYYLNGLLLELSENSIRSVATDGHRLAMATYFDQEWPGASKDTVAILPRKSVTELVKLLQNNESLLLSIDANHLKIKADRFSFTSKLIDGRFPDYKKVLPRNPQKVIVTERAEFREALVQASILCNEKFRGVRLTFEPGQITITSSNPEQEEAEIVVESDYSGETMEMGFNVSYLLDVLTVIRTERLKISMNDTNSSTLFEEQDGNDCQYVVMPMRL